MNLPLTAAKALQGDNGGFIKQHLMEKSDQSALENGWLAMSNPLCRHFALGNSRGILVTFFASFSLFLGRMLSIIPRGDATAENEGTGTCSDLDIPQEYFLPASGLALQYLVARLEKPQSVIG